MPGAKPFRAVDVGTARLKLAEFAVERTGGLRLLSYSFQPVAKPTAAAGAAGAADEGWRRALETALSEPASRARETLFCAPAGETFFRFFKVPATLPVQFEQFVEFEARQQVPIPLAEMVWSHQLTTPPAGQSAEVMFAAVRRGVLESLGDIALSRKLDLTLVEAPPAALANAFRFNYGDFDGCSLLLDLGAHSTHVLVCEPERFFVRTLNLGSGAIAREFAQQARVSLEEAERLIVEDGFLGPENGAGAASESPQLNLLGKAARQVMARLAVQIHQTLQHYRAHHGGAAPERLFLAGGIAGLPQLAAFLADRLHLTGRVEFFNPLRNVALDPALDAAALAAVAHNLGPVVGTALRRAVRCPVELDLLPPTVRHRQNVRRNRPYALAAAAVVVLALLTFRQTAALKVQRQEAALRPLTEALGRLQHERAVMASAQAALQNTTRQLDQYQEWLGDRPYWAELTTAVSGVMSEFQTRQKVALSPRTEVWVERWLPVVPNANALNPFDYSKAPTNTVVSQLKLTFRARDLASVRPDANAVLTYALLDAFKRNSRFFTVAKTSDRVPDERDQTFTVEITLQLKRPMKL